MPSAGVGDRIVRVGKKGGIGMSGEQPHPQIEQPKSPIHDFAGMDQAYEAYTDAMNIQLHGYTVTLIFGTREGPEKQPRARVILRMSPQFAKEASKVLEQVMKKVTVEIQQAPPSAPTQ